MSNFYKIDWGTVNTVEDMKNILMAFNFQFESEYVEKEFPHVKPYLENVPPVKEEGNSMDYFEKSAEEKSGKELQTDG